MTVLDDISYESDSDRGVKARGILGQIDLNFVGLLVVFRKVLGDTKCLSDLLQSPNTDLLRAVDLIEALRQRFEEYRNEKNHLDELWNTIVEICGKCSIPITVRLKRVTQTTRALDDSFVTSTLGQRSQVDSKDAFRRRIFLPIMDSLISEMEKRFSKSSIQIMKGIQGLNPASDVFLREDVVVLLAEAYGSNVQDLENELKQAQRLFARYKEHETNSPSSLIDLVKCLEPFKEVMCELYRLCKIAAVLPVSTAECERSFSTLKLVKDHLRSTMGGERLTNLAVLSIESERAKALDLNMFVQRYVTQHQNCRLKLS